METEETSQFRTHFNTIYKRIKTEKSSFKLIYSNLI